MLILCVFCEIKVEINSVFIQVTFFLESFVEKTIVCPLNYYFDTFVKSPFITCIWVYFWTSFSFIYLSVFVLYGLNYCSFTKVLIQEVYIFLLFQNFVGYSRCMGFTYKIWNQLVFSKEHAGILIWTAFNLCRNWKRIGT